MRARVIPPAGVVEALLLCIPQRVFPFPPPFPPRALEGAARLQFWEQLRKFQPPSKEGGKEVRQEEGGEGRQGVWERMIRGRDMKGRAGTDGPPPDIRTHLFLFKEDAVSCIIHAICSDDVLYLPNGLSYTVTGGGGGGGRGNKGD